MARFEIIDQKPVPGKLYNELVALKAAVPGSNLNSCLRTQQAVSYARSKGCTLSSQQELYDGFVQGRPGFNPANPPGRSTHERRNDGVAYPGPAGRPLAYYQVGMDWNLPGNIADAARRRGWICTVTYPGSSREAQHLNFRKEPILARVLRPLKRGSRGRRVKALTGHLHFLRDEQGNRYLSPRHVGSVFGVSVEDAVKSFQKHHHQKPDGVVGPHTRAQLAASVRYRKKHPYKG